MESLNKIVVIFTFLALFQLLATSISAAASEDCGEKCGNMTISYPFGIKDGCFRPGFQTTCNETTGTAFVFGDVEIIDISLSQAQMRVYNYISYSCNQPKGGQNYSFSSYLGVGNLSSTYRISYTRNKFTAVGCQTFAFITDRYSYSVDSPGWLDDTSESYYSFATGCLSSCTNKSKFRNNSTCSGIGCCETAIPEGITFINITFDSGFLSKAIWDYSPCSTAFFAENGFYSFLKSDIEQYNLLDRYNWQAPVVLDWVLGNEACKQAKLNRSGDYACLSSYSSCMDSKNGPGYTCICRQGYEGNPYVHDGCTDVDECNTTSLCHGDCTNLPGSYNCQCPSGTIGNASIEGSCKAPAAPKSQKLTATTIVLIIIGGLSTFLVTAIIHLIHRKAKLIKVKEKCFRQNGGLLLQSQINAHQSVRFRIFSIKEIMKATNNFEDASIKGRGGHGIVYKGIIDCRRVAIKKSIMIDEKRVKEFVKEMYILSLINHKNVVQILGCCLEVEVPILVYEFVARGTLYQRIQEKNRKMSLKYRLQIAIDCASALSYLHYDSFPPVVHGDIKSSNILLDENNIAKISDFGASMLPLQEINEKGVPGTFGYLDPESLITGQLTNKSDVYSFAVVVLELLTRRKAVYYEEPGKKLNLAETFTEEGLDRILDDEMKDVMTNEQILEFSELLNVCLKDIGSKRPTMKKVVAWLRRIQEFDPSLSDDIENYHVEPAYAEASDHNSYTTRFYSLGNRVQFELDYSLTR